MSQSNTVYICCFVKEKINCFMISAQNALEKLIYFCLLQKTKQTAKQGDASRSKTSPWNGLPAARSNESGSGCLIVLFQLDVECRKIYDII